MPEVEVALALTDKFIPAACTHSCQMAVRSSLVALCTSSYFTACVMSGIAAACPATLAAICISRTKFSATDVHAQEHADNRGASLTPTLRDRPMYCSLPSAEYTAYTPAVDGKLLAWPSSVRTGMASAVERLLLVLAAAQIAGDLRAASAVCLLMRVHAGT